MFCSEKGLLLMADEVYQENVYNREIADFVSFKKVHHALRDKCSSLQMVSFHSISKGFTGECGKRGGYYELHGIEGAVKDEIYKLASVALCPNVTGQSAVRLPSPSPFPSCP